MVTDGTRDPRFRLSSLHGLAVVTPPAEIDFANAAALGETLALASTAHATVIVDMSANVLCDSSGVAELVKAHKRTQAAGGELRVVMPSPHIPKVFKATGLDRIIKVFGTLSAAAVPASAHPQQVARGQIPE
jgi:anti-sigma B factor antagonist